MEDFAFKIGDLLMHKGQRLIMGLTEGSRFPPPALFVVSRFAEGCPGGARRHYGCRIVSAPGVAAQNDWRFERFNEAELEPWSVLEAKEAGALRQEMLRVLKESLGEPAEGA